MILYNGAYLLALFLIISGSALSIFAGKLTHSGGVAGALVALSLYLPAGFPALCMLGAFFVSAVAATSWGKSKKQQASASSSHQIKRSAAQVLANAAVPAAGGLMIYILPQYSVTFLVMIGGSMASATADTLSSELGMIYGRRFYNILTFKEEAAGPDGVVSLEGTIAGLGGTLLIAFIYSFGYNTFTLFPVIVFAGMFGNTIDSVLGSALERRGLLTNNGVNFLNTLCAAVAAAFFMIIFY